MTAVESHESLVAIENTRAIPRNPGILIVDDMGLILTMLKVALHSHGFNVWVADNGDDAISLFRLNLEEIDLVILDVQMPGLDGPQTLAALRRIDPNVLACFMTGNSGNHTRSDLLKYGVARVFNKPFSATTLVQSVQELLEPEEYSAHQPFSSRPKRRIYSSN
jgi:DNA-binding response OmpR family regulator